MVYWCTLINIMLQRSISYTLASFGRHYSPTTQSHAYMQASIQTLSTYVGGELMLPIGVLETCPYPFTHGKFVWASNMDSIEFQFISLWKGCHQLPKREKFKALVWFWWINDTLSANLVYQSDHEIGSTFQVVKQMVKIMMMVWTWSSA